MFFAWFLIVFYFFKEMFFTFNNSPTNLKSIYIYLVILLIFLGLANTSSTVILIFFTTPSVANISKYSDICFYNQNTGTMYHQGLNILVNSSKTFTLLRIFITCSTKISKHYWVIGLHSISIWYDILMT